VEEAVVMVDIVEVEEPVVMVDTVGVEGQAGMADIMAATEGTMVGVEGIMGSFPAYLSGAS
jgi:hypothetical protein